MAEQNNVKSELSLAEIFKILLRKFKVLLITLLAGIVVGAGFGIATTKTVDTYGTQVNFFANPIKQSSSSQIINGTYGENVMSLASTLLVQDDFAELLLLDENGDPHEYVKACAGEEENASFSIDDLRETSQYVSLIQKIKSAMNVFYDENVTSFIYVEIKVPNDKVFAQFLYMQLCEKVPTYLEESLPLPTGYDQTVCKKVSRIDGVRRLGAASPVNAAIKYALVLGLAALLVGCVVVVVLERTKANKAAKACDCNAAETAKKKDE